MLIWSFIIFFLYFHPLNSKFWFHSWMLFFPLFNKETCRVSVFRPGPLQWICREWVQKLGSDGATACFGGEKYTESDGPTSHGERTPRPKMWTPNSSPILGASLLSLGFLFLLSLWDLYCYISFSSVHPPPTLVSHPYPYLSARSIGYSLWHSVSCCGLHLTV